MPIKIKGKMFKFSISIFKVSRQSLLTDTKAKYQVGRSENKSRKLIAKAKINKNIYLLIKTCN